MRCAIEMDSTNSLTTSSSTFSTTGVTILSSTESRKRRVANNIRRIDSAIASMGQRTISMDPNRSLAASTDSITDSNGVTSVSSMDGTDTSVTSMDLVEVSDKRLQSNTLGNTKVLSQVKRREVRAHQRLHNPVHALSDICTDEELFLVLQKSSDCCEKNTLYGGCIRKAFAIGRPDAEGYQSFDLPAALTMIRSGRNERGKLSGYRLDSFIQEKVRGAIVGETTLENGEVKFEMHWRFKEHTLCRQSFGLVFGISKHKLDLCLSQLKISDTRSVTAISISPWKDEHIHGFTFAETESIMKKNLGIAVVGKRSPFSKYVEHSFH